MPCIRHVSAAQRAPADAKTLTAIKMPSFAGSTFNGVDNVISKPSCHLSADILAMFDDARRLRTDAQAVPARTPLRGCNLALLHEAPFDRDASAFYRAATDLGARVAEIRFVAPANSASGELGALARLLGRMYDAIDCGELAHAAFARIDLEAGVPVYDGLGLDEHPTRGLADLMTLCDCRSPAAPEDTILFLGDAGTRRGQAFVSAARELGFDVRTDARSGAISNDATFVIDATDSPHWQLHRAGRPIDEALRSGNHRCMIQAVLLDTIARV